jgi:hypothetical protein
MVLAEVSHIGGDHQANEDAGLIDRQMKGLSQGY